MLSQAVASFAAPTSVRRQVREGLQRHSAGEYAAAAESFAKAAEELPDDPRVDFDRACALAALGKREEATDFFQRAANSRDGAIVTSSHYNLGCLVASEAKELLGDQPDEAAPEVREQIVKLVGQAVVHYRDTLRGDPDHKAARRNLEVLRLWLKHMQDVWARRDREKRREEMDVLQFLDWITEEQRLLEATTKALDQVPSSPRQRQAIRQTDQGQRMLAEEVEHLIRKIEAAVGGAEADPPDAAKQQAVAGLTKLAIAARTSMSKAATNLSLRSLASAIESQSNAIDSLNDIYRAIAPFESVLQKATASQSQLLDVSKAADEDESGGELDAKLLARDQRFVSGWAEVLPEKARAGLSQIPQTVEPPADDQEAQQAFAQQQAMKESYEKAIELSPQVVELTKKATSHVTNANWLEAVPNQQEALKLLKEMAPKTPPEDQQDQESDEQKKDEEQNQDKKQQDQEDKQKKNNEENDQKKDQQDGNKKQDQSKQDKQQQRQKHLSRQQAETILRKARQREREHREREKKMRALLRGTVPVDRDW